ncbi:MAG: DUF151 domain-containing protein, partial [Candidatus Aenigmatarchaeota archaeon]
MKAKFVFLIALFAVFFAGFITGLITNKQEKAFQEEMVPSEIPHLSTEGFTRAYVDTGPSVIYLVSDCRRLTLVTNEIQSESVEMGLSNITGFRPNTHDLIKNIIENYEIKPLMVKVESLAEGTYYSKILMIRDNNILNLDSRPSDAIAIAV